jgi:hypothetical protein
MFSNIWEIYLWYYVEFLEEGGGGYAITRYEMSLTQTRL